MEKPRTRWAFLSLIVPLLTAIWLVGPVSAHHKAGHEQGGGPKAQTTTMTEDNDGDGEANAPDSLGNSDNQHPSGADKHVESGGSGNQGKSASDPDGGSNGGLDKAGGDGGDDIYDQDGNNGCGNDDDFEDDNNGNCGGPGPVQGEGPDRGPKEEEDDRGGQPGGRGGGGVAPRTKVLPKVVTAPAPVAAAEVAAVPAPTAELAFTGLDIVPLVALVMGLLAAGTGLLILARRRAVVR